MKLPFKYNRRKQSKRHDEILKANIGAIIDFANIEIREVVLIIHTYIYIESTYVHIFFLKHTDSLGIIIPSKQWSLEALFKVGWKKNLYPSIKTRVRK